MTAITGFTAYRPTHVDGIKFGGTRWSDTEFQSALLALDTTFDTNNATVLADLVGARSGSPATEIPVISEAWAKEISYSGNERSVTEENLLGTDTTGAQNQEANIEPASLLEVTMTLVYRNPTPTSLFSDTTKCCLMQLDNEETSTSGLANWGFNDITVLTAGQLSLTPEGLVEQTVKFSCLGGTNSVTNVVQSSPAENWYKVIGGNYAEEFRTA